MCEKTIRKTGALCPGFSVSSAICPACGRPKAAEQALLLHCLRYLMAILFRIMSPVVPSSTSTRTVPTERAVSSSIWAMYSIQS